MAKKDGRIVTAFEYIYFSDTDEFGYSDGLNIAARFRKGSDELLVAQHTDSYYLLLSHGDMTLMGHGFIT